MRRMMFAAAMLCVAAGAPARAADLVTIQTAAGISITVANDEFARRIAGFIGDLVASGRRPSRVHCYSWAASHVAHSLHHSGHACDFNGSASRWSRMNGHRVSPLARKWGLRDGCDFVVRRGRRRVPDCGHIDAGRG